jgi:ketosteroid isomerase-like protein
VIDERAWLAAWDEPDYEAIRSFSADDLEVTAVVAALEPRHYQGKDAAVQWLSELNQRLKAGWTATKLTRLDDHTIVIEGDLEFVYSATTGAERQTYAILMRLRGDKVRWIGTFITFENAREAWELGVGE